MSRQPRAIALFVAWSLCLALLGWYVQRELVVSTDLRLFLPSPVTPAQHLLLEEIGEGPASRVLVMSIGGAAPEELADASRQLAEQLGGRNEFRFVTNGEMSLDAVPDDLWPYRYLLSPNLDKHRLDTQYLHDELQARARDLSSPAGAFLEPVLPRDPTLELLNVLQNWQPMQEPNRQFDVWFDHDGKRALLLAETRAAAFDPDQQRLALDAINDAFAKVNTGTLKLTVSGAGTFSVLMEGRTRGEAQMLGTVATVGMLLMLLIAYRSIGSVVLSSLPLASAGLGGLAAVSGFFGEVHGITLAFGFTLIGVAQDYPIHLLSHRRPGQSALELVRGLWPTLATGVASTCIAYLTFLFSGVIGLAQLACFTIVGLAVAGLTTRFLLPRIMGERGRDQGQSQWLDHIWHGISGLPRPLWAAPLVALAAIAAAVFSPQPMWENDLSKLTPLPRDLLIQDQELRSHLGTPDVRYMLVLNSASDDEALQRLEQLDAKLQDMIRQGAITGYDHAARYVPAAATQLARQQKLPDAATLRESLRQALIDAPFREGVFEPFLVEVAKARELPPLTVDRMRGTPLGAGLEMLLSRRGEQSTAIVTFSGVNNADALQSLATAAGKNAVLLDLKAASESLVAQQRTRILWSLAISSVLLTAVIAFSLRSWSRVLRVLAPMVLTTFIIVALLQATGVSLTLFHLIALLLAAGLGLDYALFFEHVEDDPGEQRRTLHAVLVCSLSTLMVFALLGWSELPVLRAIGVTVSLGVISNFILALLLTREKH